MSSSCQQTNQIDVFWGQKWVSYGPNKSVWHVGSLLLILQKYAVTLGIKLVSANTKSIRYLGSGRSAGRLEIMWKTINAKMRVQTPNIGTRTRLLSKIGNVSDIFDLNNANIWIRLKKNFKKCEATKFVGWTGEARSHWSRWKKLYTCTYLDTTWKK